MNHSSPVFSTKIAEITAFVLALCTCLGLLSGCGRKKPAPEPDPHEGQVYLYDGYDWVWYTPIPGLATNALTKEDFQYSADAPHYLGSSFTVKRGIDVSEHQKEIDWSAVATQNFDFIYVRAGRRGYTEGGLFEDEKFEKNMVGARSCGAQLGVYFFSQAITVAEAIEEANWLIDRISGYNITLPVAFDWEKVDAEDARTNGVDVRTLTDCAVAFCETIRRAGYTPCVYYNRTTGYYRYDLSRLSNYYVWFSLPCTPPDVTFPSFYYHIDMWQYSLTGTVPGIPIETDLDYMFIPVPQLEPTPEEQT